MNSLTYLSRQFDVLASARTPPSTPSSDRASFFPNEQISDSDPSLKRVRTWSTKSLLFPPPPSPYMPPRRPKRSLSSPSGFHAPGPSSRSPPSPSINKPLRPKSKLEILLRRLFFVRVFVLLWNAMCTAWTSVIRRHLGWISHEAVMEPIAVTDEKDTEGETDDETRIPRPESPPQPSSPFILPASNIPFFIYPSLPTHSESSVVSERRLDPQALLPSPPPSSTPTRQPSPATTNASRSPTPVLAARKTPFHLSKTLVLDLDETLIHATSRPISSSESSGTGFLGLGGFRTRNKGAGHTVEVVLGGRSTLYHVYKRPFVDYFLRKVSGWYTLVIFTASMQEYADPVIDWLDAGRGIFPRRFFRESCTQLPNGQYTKDLSVIEQDLSRVCLVDNSPISYHTNEANGIPIEGWTHDPSDEALLALLPILDSLRFTSDVRRVLGIRGFS